MSAGCAIGTRLDVVLWPANMLLEGEEEAEEIKKMPQYLATLVSMCLLQWKWQAGRVSGEVSHISGVRSWK
jgi:hypothetical protein